MSYLKEHDDHIAEVGNSTFNVIYVSSYLGGIEIQECTKCGYLIVKCDHQFNAWDGEGIHLLCTLCGADGT